MAKAMVTLTWCDWHLTEHDEEVPATAMPVFDGMQLDLCDECAQAVVAMRSYYQTYGSQGSRTMKVPAGKVGQMRPPRSRMQLAAAGAMAEGKGQHLCPAIGCGGVYGTRGSLSAHVRQTHDTTLPLLEGKPATEKCPDCDQAFASRQALLMHQRKHAREQPAKAQKTARKSA